jgi:hypothetical protein
VGKVCCSGVGLLGTENLNSEGRGMGGSVVGVWEHGWWGRSVVTGDWLGISNDVLLA